MFDKASFEAALNSAFDKLGPAQAMFDAGGQSPNVADLLESTQSIAAFDLSFSTGIKVDNALSVFSGSAESSANLFFRLETLGIFAEASLNVVNLNLFSTVNVKGGNFLVSAGLRMAAPFEAAVTLSGSLASGITFGNELTNLRFEPYGQLMATLPFDATINGVTQKLRIKFEDDNLFDTQEVLVKVDFPVCPIVNVVDTLLAKLGALSFSPKSILGAVSMIGTDIGDTLDEFYPDVSQFLDGILAVSGSNALHLPAHLFWRIIISPIFLLSSPPLNIPFLFSVLYNRRRTSFHTSAQKLPRLVWKDRLSMMLFQCWWRM